MTYYSRSYSEIHKAKQKLKHSHENKAPKKVLAAKMLELSSRKAEIEFKSLKDYTFLNKYEKKIKELQSKNEVYDLFREELEEAKNQIHYSPTLPHPVNLFIHSHFKYKLLIF
jgi:hypothetical protein